MSNSVKWTLGIAAVAAFIALTWWQSQPGNQFGSPQVETQQLAAAGDAAAPAPSAIAPSTEAQPAVEPKPEIEAKPAPVIPEFDVVRVSADGLTVIAGRAAPEQTVEILLDGSVIAAVTTDGVGQFATHLELPQTGEAQQLVLRVTVDGAASDDVSVSVLPDPEVAAAAAERAEAEKAAANEAASKATEMEATAKAAAEEAVRAEAEARAAAERAASEAESAARAAEEAAEQVATERAADAAAKAIAADIAVAESKAAAEEAAQKKAEAEAATKAAADAATAAIAADIAAAEAREAARVAADPAAGSVEPKVARQVVSAPVIILPSKDTAAAPVLVQPDQTGVTLLQPTEVAPASQITLDRITYSDAGAVVAAGRGRPGSVIRVYGNAELLEEVASGADGQWEVRIATDVATATQLLRFDAIDAAGNVVGRLETPFEYSPESIAQELKEREIVVQKGDYLWKFAIQHYGEGWRYSVIFNANSELIRDPDLIYPGQVFKVPELVQSQ